MIYWPIYKLSQAGITDILLITNKDELPFFIALLDGGEELGVNLSYQIQESAKGIADGVSLAKDFVKNDKFIVMLGDNIFEDNIKPFVKEFELQDSGGKVLLKQVDDPHRYGIPSINSEKQMIESITEKPENPDSNYCVTGIYFYDSEVFSIINKINPSFRGELEITDVNNEYIEKSMLSFNMLEGWWIDAGTHDSLFKANSYVFNNLEKFLPGGSTI